MSVGEKILVVRVGLGGDLVMITPALDLLLAARPAAELHLLTTVEGRRVLKGFDPRLTRTWLYSRRFPARLLREPQLLRELKDQAYSRIIIGESKPFYRRWLAGAAPRVHALSDATPDRHYCDKVLDLAAAAVGVTGPRGWVRLPCTPAGEAKAQALLADHGVDPGAILVGLHPTFSGLSRWPFRDRRGQRHRVWPGASFAALARRLRDEAVARGRSLAVVIDALPADRAVVGEIVAAAGGAITMLSAPPDFERYKGLLKTLDVLVTPNTGPLHFAAALGTPVVGLFSGWSVKDCGPFVPADRCDILEAERTGRPELGLAAIDAESVSAAVWRLLEGNRPT